MKKHRYTSYNITHFETVTTNEIKIVTYPSPVIKLQSIVWLIYLLIASIKNTFRLVHDIFVLGYKEIIREEISWERRCGQ